MVVMYYSNVHGQAGTSTNMLTAGIMADILYCKKSIMLQTQFRLNQLEVSLMNESARKEILEYEIGIDALMKGIKAGRNTKELLKNCCISLPGSNIDFLPGTNSSNRHLYEEEILRQFREILLLAKEVYEIVYVDIGYMEKDIASRMWQEADVLVVNLCQNIRVLNDFFNCFYGAENVVYIIGNYDKYSKLNLRTLFRLYKGLRNDNCFAIPYNTEVKDSMSEAGLINFFYKNIACNEEDYNYDIINGTRKAVSKIMEFFE